MEVIQTRCFGCGETVKQDGSAFEVGWTAWIPELKPWKVQLIVCKKCFEKEFPAWFTARPQ